MPPRGSYQERAKRIIEFYLKYDQDKLKTLKHFKDEGVPPRTIHRLISQYHERGEMQFRKITGRKRKVEPNEVYERLAAIFKEDPKMSLNDVASRLDLSRTTVLRLLRQMRAENIETYRDVDSVMCPTCHQRCDPKVIETIRKRKEEIKEQRKKSRKKSGENELTVAPAGGSGDIEPFFDLNATGFDRQVSSVLMHDNRKLQNPKHTSPSLNHTGTV